MKKILKTVLGVTALIIGVGAGIVSNGRISAASEIETISREWNIGHPESEVVTGSAFTYNIYPSVDNTKAWIYNIEVDSRKDSSKLNIPSTINGKTVTRLGWIYIPIIGEDGEGLEDGEELACEFNSSIFGEGVDAYHGCPGYCEASGEIKSMTIPKTVTEIQASSFSGMPMLEKITIPDRVSIIPAELFFGCDKLKTVKLPSGMSQLNPSAFDKCKKLSKMTISSKCKSFSVMDKCIVNNKEKSLVFCYASDKKYNIPKGVKVLKRNSFVGCRAKSIHIPASVRIIEGGTFEDAYGKTLGKIHDVTVAKNNKIYARDGYTIYNKKDKSLSIAIAAYNKKTKKHTYVMSNKVKRLTIEQNLVNINASLYGKALDKVYISKKLKTVADDGWGIVNSASEIIFQNTKVPKVYVDNYMKLPIFATIRVPKAANAEYKKLYESSGKMEYVDKWITY